MEQDSGDSTDALEMSDTEMPPEADEVSFKCEENEGKDKTLDSTQTEQNVTIQEDIKDQKQIDENPVDTNSQKQPTVKSVQVESTNDGRGTGKDASGTPLPPVPGIVWRVGTRLEAQDFQDKWYTAKILEIDKEESRVLIHFDGWNSRYDEWLAMHSGRIRPLSRHSERKEFRSKGASKAQEYKVGQCVFAKWHDCRMYPGRIVNINASVSYEVLFYDGYKKTVQPINIKTMQPEVKQQYAKAGLLPEAGKEGKYSARHGVKEIREKLKRRSSAESSHSAKRDRQSDTEVGSPAPQDGSSEATLETDARPEKRLSREGKAAGTRERRDSVKNKEKLSPQVLGAKREGMRNMNPGSPSQETSSSSTDIYASGQSIPSDAGTSGIEVLNCPTSFCNKTFRKQNLLDTHVKLWHSGQEVSAGQINQLVSTAVPCRRRTHTTSACSEQSESPVVTPRGSKRRKRKSEALEAPSSVVEDDCISTADTHTTSTEDCNDIPGVGEAGVGKAGVAGEGEEKNPLDKIDKDDVVNCICQINEENDLMVQCEVCLCWQHAVCMELTAETLPRKYMCVICTNPPGVRESARYSYDQDWLHHGTQHSFSFLADGSNETQARQARKTHAVVGDALQICDALKSTELQLHALRTGDKDELRVWGDVSNETKDESTADIKSKIDCTISSTISEDPLSVLKERKRTSEEKLDCTTDGTAAKSGVTENAADGEIQSSNHTQERGDSGSAASTGVSAEISLLSHVNGVHDQVEARLGLLEQQVSLLEQASWAEDDEESKVVPHSITREQHKRQSKATSGDLPSLPALKQNLKELLRYLSSVRRMALHRQAPG